MSDLVQKLVDSYTNLVERGRRDRIKLFNKHIQEFKYLLVYPYKVKDEVELLMGFSNESTVYSLCDEDMPKAFNLVEHRHDFVNIGDLDISNLTETLVIDASLFKTIKLAIPDWSQLIDAPEIMKSDFSVMTEAFCKFFALQDEQYDHNYVLIIDFNSWFGYNENQPTDLELKVVWNDSCDNKSGHRTINVLWKGEFIGFINCRFSPCVFFGTEYTVNYDKWSEMMEAIYASTGFVKEKGAGVVIVDMNSTNVEDYAYIPCVSDKDYGNE